MRGWNGIGVAMLLAAAGAALTSCVTRQVTADRRVFRAGAYAMDVTPTNFPVIVNGGFLAHSAGKANDPLHVRWLVLDDGASRVALGVLDTCLIPAEFADAVKARASKATGIPQERIALSATHTHSAPSLMQVLGTPPDADYPAYALPLIVEGLTRAVANLAPARVGWAVVQAPDHTHTRVWIRRPDRMTYDPFGARTVRANMHPGHQHPDTVGPSGPSDPDLTLLAVQTPDGRPVAVLANFAMHYFGAPAVSADYYGLFADKLGPLLGATNGAPAFVGILSQGTSGDQHWMDYAQARRPMSRDAYAGELARLAANAYRDILFQDWVPLAMRQETLRLATRQPGAKRLEWARKISQECEGRLPKSQAEVYAREQLWLQDHPTREMSLQALRVGGLGIAFWPAEVFALHGLQVKAQSPFPATMNIALANAEEGYVLPPELFPLGGYNTWACRSAMLEPEAGVKMAEALLGLLEKAGGGKRRAVPVANGPYAQAVLADRPLAYWRLEEWGGPTAFDATPAKRNAVYGTGIARWLEGPPSGAFSGTGAVNRCVHLAGGYLSAGHPDVGGTYTAEWWFWNGLPDNARGVTGVLFSRGADRLVLGGTNGAPGRLTFGALTGQTVIAPRTWNHAALVRDGARVKVYLNGQPELDGETAPADSASQVSFGGAAGIPETLEGKIDEIALYGRPLTAADLQRHVRLARRPLRVVLLASPKDHGPGEHDYPLWQARWARLLGGAAGVTVERADIWPSDAQFASADVIAAFCYLPWTPARKQQVAGYLARGGGLALIHSATWTQPKADPEVAALVGVGGFTRFRHGEVRVEVTAPVHPVCRNLPESFVLHDEPYWPPTPSVNVSNVTVLAVSREKDGDGPDKPQPLFWTCASGHGRVFGCVPGHFTRTFEDSVFRLLLLRGVAWAAGEAPDRFDELAAPVANLVTQKH